MLYVAVGGKKQQQPDARSKDVNSQREHRAARRKSRAPMPDIPIPVALPPHILGGLFPTILYHSLDHTSVEIYNSAGIRRSILAIQFTSRHLYEFCSTCLMFAAWCRFLIDILDAFIVIRIAVQYSSCFHVDTDCCTIFLMLSCWYWLLYNILNAVIIMLILVKRSSCFHHDADSRSTFLMLYCDVDSCLTFLTLSSWCWFLFDILDTFIMMLILVWHSWRFHHDADSCLTFLTLSSWFWFLYNILDAFPTLVLFNRIASVFGSGWILDPEELSNWILNQCHDENIKNVVYSEGKRALHPMDSALWSAPNTMQKIHYVPGNHQASHF